MTQKLQSSQLDLDLPQRRANDDSGISTVARVVNFVDAQTLAVRKEAIERVRHLGVFQASKDSIRSK